MQFSGMQPQIVLLREGTDVSQGKAQLISNINACCTVVDVVRTTLGPLGMDKLIFDGRSTTISNDGATIMKARRRGHTPTRRCHCSRPSQLLEISHPAAKTMVDIAKSQDAEVRALCCAGGARPLAGRPAR